MSDTKPSGDLLRLAADIVAAHVSKNSVPVNGLADLIRSVYATLSTVGITAEIETRQVPAVPIKKSVFPDYIVCLEDGKKMSMLKRHLWTAYGMTPNDYRAKWGLPRDYPMVSPNYATRRSSMAKEAGLGRKAAPSQPEPTLLKPEVMVERIPERKRGRKPGSKNRVPDQVDLVAD